MGQKVQPVPTSNHYCRRWRVLDYLRSQRAANILIATFALDAVLYLDIYISLRTAIVTPHGISAECNSSTRRGRATALRNFGTPVLMPIPFDVERPNRHNRYGEGGGARVYKGSCTPLYSRELAPMQRNFREAGPQHTQTFLGPPLMPKPFDLERLNLA